VSAICRNLAAWCHGSINQKASELAVNRSPRPDTFHDLLPDVTSLVEVEGPVLLRLLRQIPLADIDTVGRDATLNPVQFQDLEPDRCRACRQRRIPQLPHIFGWDPDLVILAFPMNQRAIDSFPRDRMQLQTPHLRDGKSSGAQRLSRPWAADPNRGQILA